MRILTKIQAADAKEMRRQGEPAFTMIEIAIAIGVIGFALVAIIGILPYGMNSQRDAREDTIISQDAPYFLDAIRNGANVAALSTNTSAQGLDFLTNYIQSIQFNYVSTASGVTVTNSGPPQSNFFSGAQIVGLLSTPQTNFFSPFFSNNFFYVSAIVRSLSGLAVEQNGLNKAMSFTYLMDVMITPFNSFAPDTTNYTAYGSSPDTNQWIIRYNRYVEMTGITPNGQQGSLPGFTNGVGPLSCNLFDLRLRFSWPAILTNFANPYKLSSYIIGPSRQTYRAVVAAQMVPYQYGTNFWWFFQPQTFATGQPQGL